MKLETPKGVWRKGAPALAAIATFAWVGISGTGIAAAGDPQQSGTVKVGATISGSGVNPTISCTWALTDNNHAGGGETQQYSDAVGGNIGPARAGCPTPTRLNRRTVFRVAIQVRPPTEARPIPRSRSCTAPMTTPPTTTRHLRAMSTAHRRRR